MPRNLELKCRAGDVAAACARAFGAREHEVLTQEDTYFVVRNGRLKLRVHQKGASELIAYERPNEPGERWSNYRSVDVTSPAGVKEALASVLGIACVVRKRRHLFLVPGARIHVDEIEDLGTFVEFEVTLENADEAGHLMSELRKGFGLEGAEGIAGSYADLITAGSPAAR